MRIISGKYKGRRFNPSGLKHTRPTTDFAREGLFNILNNQLDFSGLHVLDLFAGSGAVAVEFVSRGVEKVVSVDRDTACLKYINSLKGDLDIDNLDILKSDILKLLKKTHQKFDIIFADPPYEFAEYDTLIEIIFERALMEERGMLIIEHDKHQNFESHQGFSSQRKFGNVHFSFFSNS